MPIGQAGQALLKNPGAKPQISSLEASQGLFPALAKSLALQVHKGLACAYIYIICIFRYIWTLFRDHYRGPLPHSIPTPEALRNQVSAAENPKSPSLASPDFIKKMFCVLKIEGLPKIRGTFLGIPSMKDYTIWGSILGWETKPYP